MTKLSKKDIELDKYKNMSKQLAKEIEYLLDEIEYLKIKIKEKQTKNEELLT